MWAIAVLIQIERAVLVDPKTDVKPEEEVCKKQLRSKRWKVNHFSPVEKKDESDTNGVHPWN